MGTARFLYLIFFIFLAIDADATIADNRRCAFADMSIARVFDGGDRANEPVEATLDEQEKGKNRQAKRCRPKGCERSPQSLLSPPVAVIAEPAFEVTVEATPPAIHFLPPFYYLFLFRLTPF